MKWIKASKYVRLTEENKETAHRVGMYPINDVLLPFMQDDSKIILLRGGRGGGKSNTIALRLIQECADSEYFKCYYGRKVLDRVRGSQHQELIKAIKQLRLENEFYFSDRSNGSLTIVHIKTGNAFYAFGGDNPQSMKSISDPTHIWCDEFDQFLDVDFRALFPTIRTIRGKNIFIGSFNSYEVIKTHWILKFFYPEVYEGSEKNDYDVLEGVTISRYLINFTDNYFINQEEYEKQLRVSAGGDVDLYDGLAKGEWGLDKKGNEYFHSFKQGVHVASVPYLSHLPIHLTYDFNLLPYMTLVACQIHDTVDEFQIRIFKEYCYKPPLNTTEDVTAEFLGDYIYSLRDLFYYGDAMGTRGVEGFGSNFTRFDPVREVLGKFLSESSDRTTRKNLGVTKRRDLINKILSANLTMGKKKVSIIIDGSCIETIADFKYLKLGPDGKLKEKIKDPVTGAQWEKYGHTSDAFEYFICYILEMFL
ncbi:MAG: phage terminase large subunit [Agriterribacter sp.]